MAESLDKAKQSIIIALNKLEAQRRPLTVARVQQIAARGFQGEHQTPLYPSDFTAALSELAKEGVLAVEQTSPATIRRIKRRGAVAPWNAACVRDAAVREAGHSDVDLFLEQPGVVGSGYRWRTGQRN